MASGPRYGSPMVYLAGYGVQMSGEKLFSCRIDANVGCAIKPTSAGSKGVRVADYIRQPRGRWPLRAGIFVLDGARAPQSRSRRAGQPLRGRPSRWSSPTPTCWWRSTPRPARSGRTSPGRSMAPMRRRSPRMNPPGRPGAAPTYSTATRLRVNEITKGAEPAVGNAQRIPDRLPVFFERAAPDAPAGRRPAAQVSGLSDQADPQFFDARDAYTAALDRDNPGGLRGNSSTPTPANPLAGRVRGDRGGAPRGDHLAAAATAPTRLRPIGPICGAIPRGARTPGTPGGRARRARGLARSRRAPSR